MEEISFTKVKLPYGWLGNMAPYPIVILGERWRTSEALFQAMRFYDDKGDETGVSRAKVRLAIQLSASPMKAKMLAKQNIGLMTVNPRSPEDVKNMQKVLYLKLSQHPVLTKQLLETGNAKIIEDCSSRANISGLFWGAAKVDGKWEGENTLGKLWMGIREFLLSGTGLAVPEES
jgi:predicted NAD-dependent protein-ADP-ribosyltransferase YbiA (DUF1768 family)